MINLCFHGVGLPERTLEPGEGGYWISRDLFLRVLDLFVDNEDVAISFDDGNSSDVEAALPALLERGLLGTFFALAGRLDSPGSLDGFDLRLLRRHGMTIGSHGMNHVPWRGLDDTEQQRELVVARDMLTAASGGPVDQAALPLGRYDRRTLRWLRTAGYDAVYSSDRLPDRVHGFLRPRYSIRSGDTVQSVERILGGPGLREYILTSAKIVIKSFR